MTVQTSKLSTKLFMVGLAVCAYTTNLTTNQLSNNAVVSTYQGKDGAWQYFEYLFVTQTEHKINQMTNHGFSALGAAGAATLGLKYALSFTEAAGSTPTTPKPWLSVDVPVDAVKNLVVALSALAAGNTAYNYFLCYTKRKVQKETLVSILENWQLHRNHIPLSFVECFDELYVAYQEQGANVVTDEVTCQVFGLVRHHLEHYFSGRYKPEEVKKETTISNVKSITDVMKNLA